MRLTDPLPLGGRAAPSRVLFGPHETDLGHRRELSPRHVGVAELLAAAGRPVAVLTPDRVVGARLFRTGDLAPANTRLQRAGVHRRTTTLLRSVGPRSAVLADRWNGRTERVPCAVLEGRRAAPALHSGAEVDRCPVPA